MTRLDSLHAGRAIRGTPRPGGAGAGRFSRLGLLACFVLSLSGCQSDPCGGCGLFGPTGFFARTSYRVFHPPVAVADPCCGAAVVAPAPVVLGAPAATVVPGPPAAVVAPPVTAPSTVPPPPPERLEPVEPVPKSSIEGRPSSSSGPQSSAAPSGRAGFQTRRSDPSTRVARRRSDDFGTTAIATPGLTSRSAQASRIGAPDDALDHLPPLDLPGEVTRSQTPPPPPAAERRPKPSSESQPSASTESSPSESELEVAAITAPAPDPSSLASLGPPLSRFVAVDLKLAGGSAPTPEGLNWLAEKGYRTVLDLRETADVSPTFVSDVANRGLRYIALPVSLKSIDPDHIKRFNYEISSADSRPLFFFDKDGSTAATLWYLRRIMIDRVDQQLAAREAKELGLLDQTYWQAAAEYLAGASASPARPAAGAAASRPGPKTAADRGAAASQTGDSAARDAAAAGAKNPAPQKNASPPASVPGARKTDAAPAPVAQKTSGAPAPPEPKSAAEQPGSAPEPPAFSDPDAWRPLAAMVLTGLSLPLAFWTRTVVPSMVAKALASLPAPGLRQKSLPSRSDA